MRTFFACLKKDIKLFRSGAGFFSLCFPVALMLMLLVFMGDTSLGRAYVKPFAVAFRDEDQSPMSRSLIRQLSDIDMFSKVLVAGDENDDALLAEGAAAVITLPEDYFYRVYTMEDCPVDIVLNGDMPLQAALVCSTFVNVLDILSANQQAVRAVFLMQYGELSDTARRELYAVAADDILSDTLGRQAIFDTETEARDASKQQRLSFFVCAMSILCMFIPLTILKTLPEELSMGILPRYRAAGGSVGGLLASKLFSTITLSVLPTAALVWLGRPSGGAVTAVVLMLMFFASFSAALLLSTAVKSETRSQLYGNLIILFMLAVGGALYPLELLPWAAGLAARLTLPYYAFVGFRAAAGGTDILHVLHMIWPLAAAAVLLPIPALMLLRGGRNR